MSSRGQSNWGHSWSTTVSAATLQNAWPQIGKLQKLKVLGARRKRPVGRPSPVGGLVGSKSTISVSADSFRWAAGLKSTWWTVTNVDGS